jgi:CRP-like cAMP-binding protein
MRVSFQLSLSFMRALSLRLRYSSELMGNLALLDVPSRLAHKLLDLAQSHGQPEGEGLKIDQVLKQSELAAMLGTTRESINKALGHFKRQNLIKVEQGYYTLLDPDALREISS